MEYTNGYLVHDIVTEISQYLGRNDLLHFLASCQSTWKCSGIFFGKYVVNFIDIGIVDLLKEKNGQNVMDAYKNYLNKCIHIKNFHDLDFLGFMPHINLIHFSDNFSKNVDNLPNIKSLIFGSRFNEKVNKLPKSLRNLSLGTYFNKKINNLSEHLQFLYLGYYFDKPIDKLPRQLVSLTFEYFFDRDVDNLPQSLKYLTFGKIFNKSVDKLPPNLISLVCGCCFNQKIDKLPQSLEKLVVCCNFSQNIEMLPLNLDTLSFISESEECCRNFQFGCNVDHIFNSGLKNLYIMPTLRNIFKIFILNNPQVKCHIDEDLIDEFVW